MHSRRSQPRRQPAFGLRDLLAVLALLLVSGALIAPDVAEREARRRDARRLRELEGVRDAIERYHRDRGRYPPASASAAFGGWDVSCDGDFVPALVREGYLAGPPFDPLDDATFHYRYRVFAPGRLECAGPAGLYVLGLHRYESQWYAARRPGGLTCAGRDWSRELDFVTGGGLADG